MSETERAGPPESALRTEGRELWEAVSKVYDRNRMKSVIIPSWLATEAMFEIKMSRNVHRLGYIGCHLQMRSIAREFCRQSFDPIKSGQGEMQFDETGKLQERYPLKARSGDEPRYVALDDLPDPDLWYNVEQLAKKGRAMLAHSRALAAVGKRRQSARNDQEEDVA